MKRYYITNKKHYLLIEVLIAMALFSLCIVPLAQSITFSRRLIKNATTSFHIKQNAFIAFSKHKESLCQKDCILKLLQAQNLSQNDLNFIIETVVCNIPKDQEASFPLLLKTSITHQEDKNNNPFIFWHTLYVENRL